ncbi:MAG: FG-GAP-like repeat-containing protein [Acidimicrobiia bacterium]
MLSSRQAARFVIVAVLMLTAIPAAMAEEAIRGTFVDDDRSKFEAYIETASSEGLVSGCNPPANDRFCPHRSVSRGEMAMMIVRSLQLPASTTDYFDDDNGLPAERAINALAEAGVTRGCRERRFCPDRNLTRGEMSSLIVGAMRWPQSGNTFPYQDLDQSLYGRSTKTLASRGALEPCNPPNDTRLCPERIVARDEAVFSLTSALELGPTASSTPAVKGLELGFADAFESLALWDGRVPSSRNRVELTNGGFRGSGLDVTIPKGSHYGADFKLDLSRVVGEEPEELFFRYYLRLDPGWAPRINGKLPGFSGVYAQSGKGGYQSTPSDPGWSARMEFFGTRDDDPRARLGYYVYHLGQEGRYGDGMSWNEAGKLNPGEWYCIEGEVTLNRPGVPDGALRAWVDGTPVFDLAGIQFRRPDEPNIKIESFWFNVYYGGKPRAERSMGMVIDEVVVDGGRVGCGAGDGLTRTVTADITGDGFDDQLSWGECAGGPCFQARTTTSSGATVVRKLGDGAWFSLDTSRIGLAAGDLNGDGRDDIVYHGRCERSTSCWRVHLSEGSSLGTPQDWGDDARFAPGARALFTGDWNGDGFDDLLYQGACGSNATLCWRAHMSDNGRLVVADWGALPAIANSADVTAADLDGDGRDDLLYPSGCPAGTCWYGQYSTGSAFSPPVNLGMTRPQELELNELFDFDGDGDDDLLTVTEADGGYNVDTRRAGPDGLGDTTTVTRMSRPVTDMILRRVGSGRPVEALITTACDEPPCVEHQLSLSGRLLSAADYEKAVEHPRRSHRGMAPE